MSTQWEYMILLAKLSSDGALWEVVRVNDDTFADEMDKPHLVPYLNELGAQGWEIVTSQVDESTKSVGWQTRFITIPNGWTETTFQNKTYQGETGYQALFDLLGVNGFQLDGVVPQFKPFISWPVGHVAVFQKKSNTRFWRYVLKRPIPSASA